MFTSIQLLTLSCDTTSKVGTKRAAYQAATDVDLLHSFGNSFGKELITEEMICNAERFLVHCIAKKRVPQHLMTCGKHFRSQK